MSARAVQIQKENHAWEINRMLRSGVVERVAASEDDNDEEDLDEEGEARVHLLVKNIMPPFLDGHIIFTKHPEPVMPVKVRLNIRIMYVKARGG